MVLSLRQGIMVALKGAGEMEKKWYGATVLDLYEDEALISLPRIKGEALAPEGDATLEVSFVDRGARYLYETPVRQIFREEALAILQPRDVEKIDFRQFPRAPVDLEVTYFEHREGDAEPEVKRGCLIDISGNGIRLGSDQIYSPGTPITLSFILPAGKRNVPVEAEGRVVRIVVDDRKDPVEYQLGLKYTRLDKNHQKMIAKFVNERLNRG